MVPVIYDRSYDRYFFGPDHPFSPVRQVMLLDLLDALGERPEIRVPQPATTEELLLVHSASLVEQVLSASEGHPRPDARHFGLGTPDVPFFEGMHHATRILAGGTLTGARMIDVGEAPIVLQLGGGLHHAQRTMASGFCVYNDLSLAIRYFRDAGWRVAYIDVDVHHGDGVQAIHYGDRNVLTISLHESGRYLYPGSGFIHEIGEEGGRGYKLNVPLEPATTDASYLEAFERVVPHALSWFQPDVLVVQCGADAHFRDPLADLLLTTRAFERIFRQLVHLAHEYAGGRALFTLGGGYDLDSTLRVWTLLYHILNERPAPAKLPETYLRRWETRLGRRLTPTLHDDTIDFEVPDTKSIENQNRLVSKRLLEMVAPHWY